MRTSIKLYEINTGLHKAFISCIWIFIMKAFVVIEKNRHRRCILTPFNVARWHGIFLDTPKWEPNKRGRVVEWTLNRAVPFSGRSLSTFYWVTILVKFFPAGIKRANFLSILSLELWVLSLILKSFIVSYFGKNSSEHQTLRLRFVWSRVCAFLYSIGPWSSQSSLFPLSISTFFQANISSVELILFRFTLCPG